MTTVSSCVETLIAHDIPTALERLCCCSSLLSIVAITLFLAEYAFVAPSKSQVNGKKCRLPEPKRLHSSCGLLRYEHDPSGQRLDVLLNLGKLRFVPGKQNVRSRQRMTDQHEAFEWWTSSDLSDLWELPLPYETPELISEVLIHRRQRVQTPPDPFRKIPKTADFARGPTVPS